MITLGKKNLGYKDLPERVRSSLKEIGEFFSSKKIDLILFGSFSTSNARSYSDLDIAYKAENRVTIDLKRKLYKALESMPTIREFDLVDYQTASNELQQNIDNDGICLSKIYK